MRKKNFPTTVRIVSSAVPRNFTRNKSFFFIVVLSLVFQFANATAKYWVGGASGAWNVATNWNTTSSATVGGGNSAVPVATDDVYFDANSAIGAGGAINVTAISTSIAGLHSLNITGTTTNVTFATATANITLSLNIGSAANALIINSGCTLVLNSAATFTLSYLTTTTQLSNISGTLQVNANNAFTTTVITTSPGVTVASGGNIINNGGTITGSAASLNFASGGTYTHQTNAGTIPTATWNAASTVNITGTTTTNPTWVAGTYGNVTWNTTGQTTATGLLNLTGVVVGGNLSVLTGTFGNTSTFTLSVTGTTSISSGAAFNYGSTGAGTFTGAVTVNGVWNNSAVAALGFGNSLAVNTGATFTASTGIYTFSGTTQTIGGTLGTITIPNLTITGTITNNMATSPGLNVTTALAGAGTLTQGSNAVLTLGGTSTTAIAAGTTLNCTTNTPNTVVYNGASPTVKATTYNNLTSSVSGTATLGAATTVANSLAVTTGIFSDGGFQITGNASGTLNIANGATLQLGIATATTEGFPTLFTTSNITLGPSSTVNYNATGAQTVAASVSSAGPATYGNLTVTGASVKTVASGGTITVAGNLTIATVGETFADNGVTVTVNGNVTNNGTHSGTGEILLTGGMALHTITGTTDTYGKLELNDAAYGATFANTSTTTTVGTLLVTAGTLTLNSFATGLTVTTSTVNGTLTFNNATGTRSMGALTVNSTGTVNITTAQSTPLITVTSLSVSGIWNNNTVNEPVTISTGSLTVNTGATFNSGTGTLTLSGTTQTIGGTISSLSLNGPVTIGGTYTNNIASLTIGGALSGAGTLTNAANNSLTLSASNTITTFTATATGNTVIYNGASPTVKGTTYYNLTFSGTGTAVLGAATTVNYNLVVSSGILSDGSFQITGNASGTLSVASGATLQIGSTGTATTFPTNYTNGDITLSAGSTVNYAGLVAQNISSVPTYSNLTVTGAFPKTVLTPGITVNGNLTAATSGGTLADGGFQITGNGTGTLNIGAGATLQIGAAGNTTETFPTNFTTANISLAATSSVNYSWLVGTTQVVAASIAGVGPATYGNLTITGATGTKNLAGAITVAGTLTVATAGETFNDAGYAITVNGGVTNNATISGGGGITLSGGSASHAISGTTDSYDYITLNDANGASFTGSGATTITGILTITSGTMTLNAFTTSFAVSGTTSVSGSLVIASATGTKTFTGDVTVNGTWNNSAGSAVTFAGNLIVNTGATFTSGAGTYTFSGTTKNIEGTIASLTFGGPVAISVSVLNSVPSLTITGILSGAGTLAMGGSTTLILIATTTTITGLNCIANVPNTVVYAPAAAATTKSSATTYYNLSISPTASVAVTQVAASTVSYNLSVTNGTFADGAFQIIGNGTGTLSVSAGATLQIGAASATITTFPTLFTTANISLAATSTVNYSTITNGQTVAVSNGTVGPSTYGNLTITGASGTKTAAGAITVSGNLTLAASALFADGGNIITVNGNVSNAGTHSGAGSITLSGGSAPHALTGTGTYANLILNDGNGAAITSATYIVTITGTLTLSTGTFAVQGTSATAPNTLVLNGPAIAGTPSNLSTTTFSNLSFGPVTNANTGLLIPGSVTNLNALSIDIVATNTVQTNNNITLNNTGVALTLTSGLLDISTNNNSLTIGSTTGTISPTTPTSASYIIATGTGQVFKLFPASATAFTFPVGDAGAGAYSPVLFTGFTPAGGTLTVGINVTTSALGAATADYISRYWTFSTSGAATSYTFATPLTLTYPSGTNVGTVSTANGDQIELYNTGSSSWTSLNSTATITTSSTTQTYSNTTAPLNGNNLTVRIPTYATYTWNNSSGGAWTTATNWTPPRTTPASSDILIFDGTSASGAGPFTVTGVPTETDGQLQVIDGMNVSFASSAAATLTLGNVDGPTNVLTVDAASTLQISTTGSIVTTLGFSGAPANAATAIAGNIILNNNGANTTALTFANLLAANNIITGTITNKGGVVTASTTNTKFGSSSTYTHNVSTAVLMPAPLWDPASLCQVAGTNVVTAAPTGFTGQTFGNFTWNCPSQTGTISLALSTATTFAGNVLITTTNTGALVFCTSTPVVTISGNFTVSAGNVYLTQTATAAVLTVTGTTNINGGSFILTNTTTAPTFTSTGTLTVASGATLNFGTGASGAGTIIAKGNIANAGTINSSVAGALLNMAGNVPQIISTSGAGTFTTGTTGRLLNLTINNSSGSNPAVDLQTNLTLQTALNLTDGIFGTSLGNTLTLGIPATAFATTRNTASSLTMTTNYGYTTGSYTLTYNGGGTATTGNELPPSTTPTNGVLSVTVGSTNISMGGSAAINQLSIAASTTFNVNGQTLTISGLATPISNSGTLTADYTDNVNSKIILAGTVAQTPINPGTYTNSNIANLQISYSSTVTGTLAAALNVTNFNISTSTTTFSTSTFAFKVAGTYSNSGTITLNGAGSSLTFNGTAAQNFTVGTYTGSSITNLVINNSNGVALGSPVNTLLLTLTSGTLTTTTTNLITVTGAGTSGIAASGTATNYINGPLARNIPASYATAGSYYFPVGGSEWNEFDLINPTTSSSGAAVIEVQEVDLSSGGSAGLGFSTTNTPNRYWKASFVSGGTNLTSAGTVKLGDPAVTFTSTSVVGYSSTLTGAYSSLGGIFTLSPNYLTSTATSPVALGYYETGDKGCFSGNYTVGPGGTYNFTNLTNAINLINASIICGNVTFSVQSNYTAVLAAETFPLAINALTYSGGPWTVTFRPDASVTSNLTVSGSVATELVNLNGASNIIFDGRPGSSGSSLFLTFTNTDAASAAQAFQLTTDANTNTLEYLNINSANTSATSGTVSLLTGAAGGNSSNTITYCNLGNSSSTAPANGIYSNGTAGHTNASNTITYNNIYNFTTTGVLVTATGNGDGWNVSNNNFYFNTGTPAATQTAINLLSGGNNNTINSNLIGGNAVPSPGIANTWTNSTASSVFTDIALSAGTTTASNIQGNTVQAITLSGGTAAGFTGISVSTGNVNIGTTAGNTIGTGTGSTASVTCNGTGATIGINSTSTGTVNIGTGGSSAIGNTIGNITNSSTGLVRGISTPASAGSYGIYDNTILNLTSAFATLYANTAASSSPVGILSQATSTGQNISQNTITGLTNNGSATFSAITGIFYAGPVATTNLISRNIINNLGTSSTSAAYVMGIDLEAGATAMTCDVVDNMISLGNGLTGTGAYVVRGIYRYGTSTPGAMNFYYNTIYITNNSAGTTSGSSYDFYTATGGTMAFKNNIFVNLRSGSSAASALDVLSVTGLTSNYNDLYLFNPITGSGTFGTVIVNGTGYGFINWQASTGTPDANSKNIIPSFVTPASNLSLNVSMPNCQLYNAGTAIGSYTADLYGTSRPGGSATNPTIGAFEFSSAPPSLGAGPYYVGSVASGDNFNSINEVISALECGISQNVTFYLTSHYSAANEPSYPLNFIAYPNPTIGANTYTATFSPNTGVNAIITSASSLQTLNFNGAGNIIFNGTALTGSTTLAISNTNAGGNTIQFINDANHITVENSTISGENTSTTSGTILFSTANVSTSGNNNISITGNNIGDVSGATPANAIYSAGTSLKPNTSNTISNNSIYNYWLAGGSSSGILLGVNNATWTISGNSLYQTATRTSTASVTRYGIQINDGGGSSGGGHTISSNYIGGSQASAGGTAYTIAGAVSNTFNGIFVNTFNQLASPYTYLEGNTISNLNFTTSSNSSIAPGVFSGIYVQGGKVNIGETTANTIGAASGTGSIVITTSTTNAASYGIAYSGVAYAVSVNNNIIGGINVVGSPTTLTHSFTGIYFNPNNNATFTISGNTIGSTVTANSINASDASTDATNGQYITGINYPNSASVPIITNNTIANLNNNYNSTVAAGQTTGILASVGSSGGLGTITGNTIYNLSSSAASTGSGSSAAVIGISAASASASGFSVSHNLIYNLSNTAASAAANVVGLYYSATTSGSNIVDGNNIHTLNLSSSSASAGLNGIYVATGNSSIYNNMIDLGFNNSGSSLTTGYAINGIYETGTGTSSYDFNSVFIGGTGVTPSSSAYAFYTASTSTSTREIFDNIFYNGRSNPSGATNYYYAARIYSATGLTSNYNDLFTNGAFGAALGSLNGTAEATLSAWQTATGKDAASISADPIFVNSGAGVAGSSVDLHISTTLSTPIESAGGTTGSVLAATVTDDYDYLNTADNVPADETTTSAGLRANLTPVDIGADAGNFKSEPIISYTVITNACTASNYSFTNVAITEPAGSINTTSGTAPRVYYKKSGDVNSLATDNTSATNGWKWVQTSGTSSPFSFTIDYTMLPAVGSSPAGGVIPGDQIQYFVVAQDNNATPVVSINSGSFAAAPGSVALTSAAFPIGGTINSFAILPCSGTVTVGTGGTYPSLTNAGGLFQALNGITLNGNLTVNIVSNLNATTEGGTGETGTYAYNLGTSPGSYTVTIQPSSATAYTISGTSPTTYMIPVIGANAKNLTINGNYSGSGQYLTFSTTSTTVPAFQIDGGATANTIENCIIQSNNATAASGAIVFGATTGSTSNSILNNTISPASTSLATGIYSNYASNTSNTISGNNIHDFTTNGISLGASNGNTWTIGGVTAGTGNNFYMTGTATSTTQTAIAVGAGTGHTISYNLIGGNAAPISNVIQGTWSNSAAVTAIGITLTGAATGTVSNNTISNFSLSVTGSTVPTFTGISESSSGSTTISSNTIQAISIPSASGAAAITGISLSGAGTPTVQSNIIGSLGNALQNAGTGGVKGILSSSTSTAVGIGSSSNSTLGNTISYLSDINASTTVSTVVGISISAGTNTIGNNHISNLGITASTATTSQVIGIATTAGINTITANTINALSSSDNASVSTAASASVIGISSASATAGQSITGNTLYTLGNSGGTGAVNVEGIYYAGPTSGTNSIAGNLIHSLTTASTSVTAAMQGISLGAGAYFATVANNMVRLGIDASASNTALTNVVTGISSASTGTVGVYYNSVYITGTASTGSAVVNTYAFNKTATSGTYDIRNNILANNRTGGFTASYHYAIQLNTVTGVGTINNNIYYSNDNSLFSIAATPTPLSGATSALKMQDFRAQFTSTTGQDLYSGIATLSQINFNAPDANSGSLDLRVGITSAAAGAGVAVSVLTDYFGTTRSTTAPYIGAYEGSSGTMVDIYTPVITTSISPTGTLALCSGYITPVITAIITDRGAGVDQSANAPLLWYRETAPSTGSWVSVPATTVSGTAYNGIYTYDLSIAGSASQTYEYYVVAQDIATTPNIFYSAFNATQPVQTNVATQVSGSGYITTTGAPFPAFSVGSATPLSGTVTVGTGGNYTTLTGSGGLFSAINANGLSGNLTVNIISNITTETGANALNQWAEYCGSGYYVTIEPNNSTLRVVSGSINNGLITFNGTTRVIVNGNNGSNGQGLQFINTYAAISYPGSPAIRFENNSNHIVVEYCTLTTADEGDGYDSRGALYISTSSSAGNGNSYLNINNNVFTNYTSGIWPTVMLYSDGSTNAANQSDTISNNQITNFGYYNSSNPYFGYGIDVEPTGTTNNGGGNTMNNGGNWVITGNSLYFTGGFNDGYGSLTIPINFLPGSGSSGNIISGNYIGGSAANCGGSAMPMSNSINYGSGMPTFAAIQYVAGSGTINSNIINNINVTNYEFIGIYCSASAATTVSGNIIGNASAPITGTSYTDGCTQNGPWYGIEDASSAAVTYTGNTVQYINNTSGSSSCASFAGIYYTGSGSGSSIINNTIYGNKLSSSVLYPNAGTQGEGAVSGGVGIAVSAAASLDIENNKVMIPILTSGSATQAAGIVLFNVSTNSYTGTLLRNVIYDSSATAATHEFGIKFYTFSYVSNWTVANNQVELANLAAAASYCAGIEDATEYASGASVSYLYNTVYIKGASSNTNTYTYAFLSNPSEQLSTGYSSYPMTIENNIFVNTRQGSGNNVAIGNMGGKGSSTWVASDYNLLVGSSTSKVGDQNTGSHTYKTFATWQSNFSPNIDLHSVSAAYSSTTSSYAGSPWPGSNTLNPENLFVSTASSTINLDITTGDAISYQFVDNKATPVSTINDITLATRSTTTPTIGSYEVKTITNDAGVPSVALSCPASTITVPIRNYGINTLNSVTIDLWVNGTLQTASYSSLGLAPGASVNETLSYTFTSGTAYTIVATTSNPNGVADLDNINDTAKFTGYAGLPSTVYVGSGSGTPNYSNYSALFSAINSSSLTGNLHVIVQNSTTEPSTPVFLNAPNICSGVDTIFITPASATTYVASGTTGTSAIIGFNGASNVVIDGSYSGSGRYLEFLNNNSSSTAGTVIFQNSSNHIVLKNSIINLQSSAASTAPVILLSTSSSGTTGNSYITISGDSIGDNSGSPGPYSSTNMIQSAGTSGTPNHDNTITNNSIFNFSDASTAYGINITSAGNGNNWKINGNSIFNTVAISVGQQTGINFAPGTSSTGDSISNNYLGGSAPYCGNSGHGYWENTYVPTNCNTGNTLTVIDVNADSVVVSGNTIERIWNSDSKDGGVIVINVRPNSGVTTTNTIINYNTIGNPDGVMADEIVSYGGGYGTLTCTPTGFIEGDIRFKCGKGKH